MLLIYPYFHHAPAWRKLWLFPPIGLGYLASILQKNDFCVKILDGTFTTRQELINQVEELRPKIVGVYCMVTMRDDALKIASALKSSEHKPLLVAGGPYPTSEPDIFLSDFDAIVIGEGEITMLEIARKYLAGAALSGIEGVALKEHNDVKKREFIEKLDDIPHPARELFDNQKYKQYWQDKFGYTCAPLITSRGCPYNCDYCARPVFGSHYRERSVTDIIKEIEEVLNLGYSRIWFSDDVFTLNKKRISYLCDEILNRDLRFTWDCLCRVDNINQELLKRSWARISQSRKQRGLYGWQRIQVLKWGLSS